MYATNLTWTLSSPAFNEQDRKIRPKSASPPSVLLASILLATVISSANTQHNITHSDLLHQNNSIFVSNFVRELADPPGFCCKKENCRQCNEKKPRKKHQCNSKNFLSWCKNGKAGTNCPSRKCVEIKRPEPTGFCCRKKNCRNCREKDTARKLCNTNTFSSWCEGAVAGTQCRAKNCRLFDDPKSLDCSTPAETPTISLSTGSFGSSWKALTTDKASRSSVKAVSVQVMNSGGGGNIIHIVEEWSDPDIVTATMPNGKTTVKIDLPNGSNARLQIWVENVQRVEYRVKLNLCRETTGPAPSPTPKPTRRPTPTPTPTPVGKIPIPQPPNQPPGDFGKSAKKSGLPPQNKRSSGFGRWPNNHLINACIRSHDRYWVYGPDGIAYHTWHPVTEKIVLSDGSKHVCEYGHEHGSNPRDSPIFRLFGGWPAFGYLLAQQSAVSGQPDHRKEDHVGHKINVASFDVAKGQPQQKGTLLEDAGFDCHFVSKIHQGGWSEDAFTNHLHEYYVAAACNDQPQSSTPGGTTWFSIKRMTPFGSPNTFIEICPSYKSVGVSVNRIIGFDGTPLARTGVTNPPGTGNREFQCFTGEMQTKKPDKMSQPNLWTGETVIQTGTGSINIAPYYIVKDASRILDVSNGAYTVKRTIDSCYDRNGNPQYISGYCTGVPRKKPSWDDPASPFKGVLRAVNFKRFQIYNNFGNVEVCTDFIGNFIKVATSPKSCDTTSGEVYQAVAAVKNDNTWSAEVNGSLLGAAPVPNSPDKFVAPGIGFEHLETHYHPTVRGQN